VEDMLISLTQAETTRLKRDHAVSQWSHRGLSVSDHSPTATVT